MSVVEESFGALGQKDGGRFSVGKRDWKGNWVWI